MLSAISCLFRRFAVSALVLSMPMAAHAQAATDSLYELRLTDGSLFVGRIEQRTAETIVVVTTSGSRVEVPASKLREMHVARGRMVRGEYWRPDPNKTRLFFSPTARAVGHGRGYVGTFFVVLPYVAVGITDYLTLAGGAPVWFGIMNPVYFVPKLTLVETRTASFAVGTLAVIDENPRSEAIGVAFGVATFGDADNAVTAGIGYGYSGVDVGERPVFMVGGEFRVARSLKLVTENFAMNGLGSVMTGGLRIFGDRLVTDVGLIMGGGACCLPILNFAYRFGSN